MSRKLTWRQLLSNPPTGWQRLSMLTRGVGDEILRALDGNGEIECGRDDPFDVVYRITGTHPRERRRVGEAVQELLDEKFLVLEERDGERLLRGQLPDIAAAARDADRKRSRKAPGADAEPARSEPEADVESTRSERGADAEQTRSGREASVEQTRSQPEVGANGAESHNSDPVEKRREEEKREEESEALAPPPGVRTHIIERAGAGGLAEVAYDAAVRASGGSYAFRDGDASAFRTVVEAASACCGERSLKVVLDEWAKAFVTEREPGRRRPAWWAEWAQDRAANGGAPIKPARKRTGFTPPAPSSSFTNTPLTRDLFRKERSDAAE